MSILTAPKGANRWSFRIAFRPSFVVDISGTFERKMDAVRSYGSQFHNATVTSSTEEPQTMISTPLALAGMVEFRWIIFDTTPPEISIPSDSGVTSRSS